MHLLIVARDSSGDSPSLPLPCAAHPSPTAVTLLPRAAAPLLAHMCLVASAFIQRLRVTAAPPLAFQAGFHSVPSLVPLHMHVMGRDFDRRVTFLKLEFGLFVMATITRIRVMLLCASFRSCIT